ncbi:MAG: hypothetical protein JAY85_15145 [Candidatus Thiodiazotropha weberae]|uniref:Uncharacterized protein n=1 Tax=Candidatus Thiodiazotropha endoloripes TaxID=1818881 RepID=A0A1E2UTS9_9GAMM|nr:hypothetical protein [Candidatus Thiodiazotropha endoloripes]MCG7899777.1 hypothetical protein [Candidatus Thiodiazotropha weberae]ODB98140.1 hypothetical protein A3196_16060 [Candidatus Thiodiazotropha endoloripes]
MKALYVNAIWFVILIVGLIGAAVQRHTSLDWSEMSDVRMNYDLLYGSLAIYLAISVYGLLAKRNWGYSLSVAANATLTVMPLAIFVASMFLVYPDVGFIELLKISMGNLAVGFISLCFWVWLVLSKEKLSSFGELHIKKNNETGGLVNVTVKCKTNHEMESLGRQ